MALTACLIDSVGVVDLYSYVAIRWLLSCLNPVNRRLIKLGVQGGNTRGKIRLVKYEVFKVVKYEW